jgi:hypothetical protein
LVILRHARRRIVTISVTSNPTAEWIAGQVTDAFPWDEAPRHLIRDRDGAFGPAYTCVWRIADFRHKSAIRHTQDRNTRLRGRFRIAGGSGERSEPRIRPFAARFIRRSQIRGHDENGPDHLKFGDRG